MNTCCPNCGTEFDPEMAEPAGGGVESAGEMPGAEAPKTMLEAITREIGAMPRDKRRG